MAWATRRGCVSPRVVGEGSPLPPLLCPHQGKSWRSEATLTDGILQRKRARKEGCPQPANVS